MFCILKILFILSANVSVRLDFILSAATLFSFDMNLPRKLFAICAGLLLALKTEIAVFAEGSRWDYRLDLPEHEMPLSDHAATMLFRIFQESITNIARHANATQVLVRMKVDGGNLVLQIEDNGKGVPQEKLVSSLGILGMQERAGSLGGQLTIVGRNKLGTNVTVSIPYGENHR